MLALYVFDFLDYTERSEIMARNNRNNGIKCTGNSSADLVNRVWDMYSFFGTPTHITTYDKQNVTDLNLKKSFFLPGEKAGGEAFRVRGVKNGSGTFVTDGGDTFKYLKKTYGISKPAFSDMLGRLNSRAKLCLIGNEIAVKITSEAQAEIAKKNLMEAVSNLLSVSMVVLSKRGG